MLVLKNSESEIKDQLSRAIEKCLSLEKKVRVRSGFAPGQYLVTGSSGHFYTIYFYRDRLGNKIASCDCPAGERGLPCYHIAAALPVHCARSAAAACSQN